MTRYTTRTMGLLGCVLASTLTAGCDARAREFAEKTAAILQQRSAQLTEKIKAETTAYQKIAAIAAEAHRDLAATTLRNERNARAVGLAADYTEGRKSFSRWRTDLLDYGQVDYAANRDLLAADIDASSRFLENVQGLKLEQDRVDALAKLLAALAKKPSRVDDLKALAAFAEDTKAAFDDQVCAQLAKQAAAGDKAAGQAFAAKKCKK